MKRALREEQLGWFDLPPSEATEQLLGVIGQGRLLCKGAQLRIFELPASYCTKILLAYVKRGNYLCKKAQRRIFGLPVVDRRKILLAYVQEGHYLSKKAQRRISKLPTDDWTEKLMKGLDYLRQKREAEDLIALAKKLGADLVTTAKDFVKIPNELKPNFKVLEIEIKWKDEEALKKLVNKIVK